MPVTDLFSWANNLEDIRLPDITSDISLLQTQQQSTQTQLDQLDQTHGDDFAAQAAQIAAAQTDATNALVTTAATTTTIYNVDLDNKAYTNQKIQELRDELNVNIALINAYMQGDLQTYINDQVTLNLPILQAAIDQGVIDVNTVRDGMQADLDDVSAVNDTIVNTELPAIHINQADFEASLDTFDANWTLQFTDYPYANLLDGLYDTRAIIAGEMASLGHEIPRLPISNWTTESSSATFDPKAVPLPEWFITNDPSFLDCVELPLGTDETFGQSYPIDFNKDRVYKVSVTLRVSGDGTLSGVQLKLGATTWDGTTLIDQNVEKALSVANATQANGPLTFECYFSGNLTALNDAGYSVGSAASDNAVHLGTVGDPTKAFFHVRQNPGLVTDGQIRIAKFKVEDVSGLTAESIIRQDALATIDGKLAAGIMMRVKAGTAGAQLELIAASDPDGDVSIARIAADDIVLDGTVQVQHMQADVLSADNIMTGQMSASRIYIDELLSIDESNAGFSIGKPSAKDITTDGIYMGRTLEDDGSSGFGLSMSKTDVSGLVQSLRATKATGLEISNALFFRELNIPASYTTYDSTITVALDPSTTAIDLEMIGAGGGGAGGANGNLAGLFGGFPGGNTVVTLKDGAATIKTWTALGGDGAPNGFIYSSRGQNGENSPYGNGGIGGVAQQYNIINAQDGTQGVGRGSGGGGGGDLKSNEFLCGKAGKAGKFKTILAYDISGLTSPTLEIAIGSGGAGYVGAVGDKNGGAGRGGRVRVRQQSLQPVPADVIPLITTYEGTMPNQGPFPNYGAGLWILNKDAGPSLNMGYIEISTTGTQLYCHDQQSVTFISDKTPIHIAGSVASADIYYRFFKMGA